MGRPNRPATGEREVSPSDIGHSARTASLRGLDVGDKTCEPCFFAWRGPARSPRDEPRRRRAGPPRPPCRIALRAESEAASFAEPPQCGARPHRQPCQGDRAAFAAAASHLCASGAIRPAYVATFSRLLVRNAEGADEPNIYDDAEQHPPRSSNMRSAPAARRAMAAIGTAIRCWRNPEREGCGRGRQPLGRRSR